jgi:DNA-binding NarL/FixJ family response regulator
MDIADWAMSPQLETVPAEELAVAAIRTVMVTLSPIFRELIKELTAGHVNLDVVGEIDSRDRLEEQLQALAPDLVFIGLRRDESDEIGLSLVRVLPNAKVSAFSSDGRHVFVHRMQPQRIPLLDVSPQMLIDAILGS